MRNVKRLALLGAIGLVAIGFAPAERMVAAVPGPTVEEVVQRLMQNVAAAPDLIAADAEVRLRVKKRVTDPPDCVFKGTVTVVSRRPTIKFEDQTTGLLCWIAHQYLLGRQFHLETLESFLARFDFDLLGEKLVGADRYFLVAAKAKDPRNQPNAMIGWIDFDRGLLIESTVKFGWGDIDNTQEYARMQNFWMPTYQYLYTDRFGTSMEVHYTNFRFGPQ